jgi:hypothetical protein
MSLNVGALLLLAGFAINCTTLAAQQASPAGSQTKGEIVMIGPFNPSYPPLFIQCELAIAESTSLNFSDSACVLSSAHASVARFGRIASSDHH